MAVYGVVNQKGKDRLFLRGWGEVMSALDKVGTVYSDLVNCNYPWYFSDKPLKGFVLFKNRVGNTIITYPQDFDWHEENELPKLIQNSFELLANEFKSRKSHDWRRSSESLVEMLLELNIKEEANDFPLTKAMLLDYEAINYSPFAKPVFKMQSAREGMKFFKGVSNEYTHV